MPAISTTTTPTDIARQWADAWSAPTPEDFVGLYAEDGEYFDVTFGVRRRGHDLIAAHHRLWRAAVPDFVMSVEDVHAGDGFVTVEVTGRGTFSGDDLGGGKMKATGKPFSGRSAAVLVLDRALKIVSCREYYDRAVMPGGAPTPFGE
ncbi:nuclear transport factor 2 family protein [Amycolatopsis solani]|uniref:nuclear transport factor 2 family protein n=1 Tax=Amycolatopsis solani TaxID=3028615 RepID=UPI0025B138D5|nr:nuclear transport factor 2 family protein [Amycolatopsis sp. MEP2-6]